MAARTVADVLTRARAAINDAGGVRATDATMRTYVVDGLNLIKRARPDLFVGSFGTAIDQVASSDTLTLDHQYFLALAMFVGSMVEHQDEDSADRARGELLTKIGAGVL